MVAHQALTKPTATLNWGGLAAVSWNKSEANPKSLLHLCGHKFCAEPSHISIGSKKLNEEQTSCHRLLQSTVSLAEYLSVQRDGCKHIIKCWTNVYKGQYKEDVVWTEA